MNESHAKIKYVGEFSRLKIHFACIIEARGSRLEDRASRIEPRGSSLEDRASRIEPRGSSLKDRASRFEPQGSSVNLLLSSTVAAEFQQHRGTFNTVKGSSVTYFCDFSIEGHSTQFFTFFLSIKAQHYCYKSIYR